MLLDLFGIRLGSLQYDAPHNCLEFGLRRKRHAPATETRLVDENDLEPMVAVFPNECPTSLPDVRHGRLVDLVGLTKGYCHAAAIGEPARLAFFAEARVCLGDPAEVLPKSGGFLNW